MTVCCFLVTNCIAAIELLLCHSLVHSYHYSAWCGPVYKKQTGFFINPTSNITRQLFVKLKMTIDIQIKCPETSSG